MTNENTFMSDPNPKDKSEPQYPGIQGVIPIPLGAHGEGISYFSHNRYYETTAFGGLGHIFDDSSLKQPLSIGGIWEKISIPYCTLDSEWTPENDANRLPKGNDESDEDYAERMLANKDKKDCCSVEYKSLDALTFYCDSVSWDGNYANMDRSGDGSSENPWRNVQYALHMIGCNFMYSYAQKEYYTDDRWVYFTSSKPAAWNGYRASYQGEHFWCCTPMICLRVKGTINYSICNYVVSKDGTITGDQYFSGQRKFILTSWGDEPFKVNVSYAHGISRAVNLAACHIGNCEVTFTIDNENTESHIICGLGSSGITGYGGTSKLWSIYWNCKVNISGNANKARIQCFNMDVNSYINCSTSVSGICDQLVIGRSIFNSGMTINYNVTGKVAGIISMVVTKCTVSGTINGDCYLVVSRICSGMQAGIKITGCKAFYSMRGGISDDFWFFANGWFYPIFYTFETTDPLYVLRGKEIASNCNVSMEAEPSAALNLHMIRMAAIDMQKCYNCVLNLVVAGTACNSSLYVVGIGNSGLSNRYVSKCKSSITLSGSNTGYSYGAATAIGVFAADILDSNVEVTVTNPLCYAASIGCHASKVIDTNINVSATSNKPMSSDLCSELIQYYNKGWRSTYSITLSQLGAYALGIHSMDIGYYGDGWGAHWTTDFPSNATDDINYALRCNITAYAKSSRVMCADPPTKIEYIKWTTVYCEPWGPTLYAPKAYYSERHGGGAYAGGCFQAIQSTINATAVGQCYSYAKGVYATAKNSNITASATSAFRDAEALGIGSQRSRNEGCNVSAGAGISDWADSANMHSSQYAHQAFADDNPGSYDVQRILYIFKFGSGDFGYAYDHDIRENEVKTKDCFEAISGNFEDHQKCYQFKSFSEGTFQKRWEFCGK
jgi:hypothetical protein